MIIIPDSALNEVNHCHGKGSKGHPCRYGPVTTFDPKSWTLGHNQLARGMVLNPDRRIPKAVVHRLIDGEATGEDLVGLLPGNRGDGHVNVAGAAPFEFAYG